MPPILPAASWRRKGPSSPVSAPRVDAREMGAHGRPATAYLGPAAVASLRYQRFGAPTGTNTNLPAWRGPDTAVVPAGSASCDMPVTVGGRFLRQAAPGHLAV